MAAPACGDALCAFGLALIFFLCGGCFLGVAGIGGSSEAREAHVVSVILRSGEWILPLRNGVVPSKPMLFHWFDLLPAWAAGVVSPFVARLPSLVFGAGLVFVVTLLAIRCARCGESVFAQRARWFGFVSAFILSSIYGFSGSAMLAMVDMTFSFWVWLALIWPVWSIFTVDAPGEVGTPVGKLQMNAFFVTMALAVLCKGPLGFVLPSIVLFVLLWRQFSLDQALRICFRPRLGWLLFLLLVVPWYVAATVKGQADFVGRQFFFENLKRVLGGEDINSEVPWFYFRELLSYAAPWSWVALAAAVCPPCRGVAVGERFLRNCGRVFLVGVLLFSLSSGKRQSYLLPLYPFLGLFVSWVLFAWFQSSSDWWQGRWRGVFTFHAWVALFFLSITIAFTEVLKLLAPIDILSAESVDFFVLHSLKLELGALILFVLLGCVVLRGRATTFAAGLISYTSFLFIFFAAVGLGRGVKAHLRGFDRQAAAIRSQVGDIEPLFVVRSIAPETFDPILYYLMREVTLLPRSLPILTDRGYVILKVDDIEPLLQRGVLLPAQLAGEVGRYNLLVDAARKKSDHAVVLLKIGAPG